MDNSTQKYLKWLAIGLLLVLAVLGICLRVSSAIANASTTTPRVSESTQTTVKHVIKRETEIEVGPEWYDPNVEMLHVNIEGYPLDRNVRWQQKALYSDGTYITVHMPSFNDCVNGNFTKRVTFTNMVTVINDRPYTNTVDAVFYSIEPDQGIGHSTFRFKYSLPRY